MVRALDAPASFAGQARGPVYGKPESRVTLEDVDRQYHEGPRDDQGRIACPLCPPGTPHLHPIGYWPHVSKRHKMRRTPAMRKQRLNVRTNESRSSPASPPASNLPAISEHHHTHTNNTIVHAPNAQTVQLMLPQAGEPLPDQFRCCFRCGFNFRSIVLDTSALNNCPSCGQPIRQIAEAAQFLASLP